MSWIELTEHSVSALEPRVKQYEVYDRLYDHPGSFGVRVNPSGKKVLFLIYNWRGKRRRVSLGRYPQLSVAEARQRASTTSENVFAGRDPATEAKLRLRPLLFRQLAAEFFLSQSGARLKPRTLYEYQRIFQIELAPAWGELEVTAISAAHISALYRKISVERGSVTMANRVLAFARRLFEYGRKANVIPANPAAGFDLSTTQPAAVRGWFEFDEIKRLWMALNGESRLISTLFRLALLTGQRPGDVCAMRWSELELDSWNVGARGTRVPLAAIAIQLLRDWRSTERPQQSFVFPGIKPDTHIQHIRRAAYRAGRRAGLSNVCSPLSIRRSVEVGLRQLGIPARHAKSLLNPGSYRSAAISDQDLMSAISLWNKKIAELIGPPRASNVVSLFGDRGPR
jgi:integrase